MIFDHFGNVFLVKQHAVDNGKREDLQYLDFQKTFDELLHQRLLWKIVHGGGGNILAWRGDCVKQRVEITVLFLSDWQDETNGTTQGLVMNRNCLPATLAG